VIKQHQHGGRDAKDQVETGGRVGPHAAGESNRKPSGNASLNVVTVEAVRFRLGERRVLPSIGILCWGIVRGHITGR